MASSPKKGAAEKAAVAEQVETVPDLPNEFPSASEAVEAIVEPALEMQESVRSALQKGVVESRAAFVKAKVSADDAVNALESVLAAAKDGVVAFNAKAFAAAQANAEANFDFVKASLAAKSVADLVSLQSEFARKQTDAVVVQFKDLAETAKKAVVETFEPIKSQLTKSFKIAV
ncbi:phasin [Roseiarcus fermentans]|uniref:Phasin n=1 Tax=Roseiarcus fermentans TaxID=1473586 RepID=A0A366FPI6_9HYPH|nr:phasin family protein [Roseiarcus fermentans]RBP16467.1 phasin [Roseiarcus fermentans]